MTPGKPRNPRTEPHRLAKLMTPVLPRVVERPRLFRQLDRTGKNPLTWIVGPPGAGKTTLVASYLKARKRRSLWCRLDEGDADLASFFHYLATAAGYLSRHREPLPVLTPEYALGLKTFVRRFFQRLCERLPAGSVIVFDNYQDVANTAPLHGFLPAAFEEIPRQVSVIVISREAPPVSFATMISRRQLARMEPDELQLTGAETRQLIRLFRPKAKRQEIARLETLARESRGWVAGVILLLERAQNDAARLKPGDFSEMFRYLANEGIGQLPAERQEFLLKTSLLPEMTATMAAALSGADFAADYLTSLYRTRYFIERVEREDTWYRFHPLFRDCLLDLAAQRLAAEELRQLRQQAARLLIEHNRQDDALALLRDAQDWPTFVAQALSLAPVLVQQGRLQTLDGWLTQIPEPVAEAVPWIGFWRAVCRIPVDPFEAQTLSEKNYNAFKAINDPIGTLAAWSNTITAIFIGDREFNRYDYWIEQFPYELPEALPAMPPELELMVVESAETALFSRQPGTARTLAWVNRVIELRRSGIALTPGIGLFVALSHCLWLGDIVGAKRVLAISAASGAAADYLPIKVAHAYAESVIAWFDAESDHCRAIIAKGLELAKQEGVVFWEPALFSQGAYNELFSGNLAAARSYIDRLRPPPQQYRGVMYSLYLSHEAWFCVQQGDFTGAVKFIDRNEFDAWGPFPDAQNLIILAYARFGLGELTEAAAVLQRVDAIGAAMNSDLIRHGSGFLAAALAFAQNDNDAGYAHLKGALEIGRRRGLFGWCGWHAPTIGTLCAKALNAGIEVEYVKTLLKKRWVPLPAAAQQVESWSWPVKIYTLGEFRVLVDDEPLGKNRKAPHRLMDFLKTLIAFGGTDVSATKLMDTLWPDADGAAAKVNLEKTLQRLRHLLRQEQILPVRAGRVSLNPELCWVDAFAFEKLIDAKPDDPSACQQPLALYKGPFLDGDDDMPWADDMRTRLGNKYDRACVRQKLNV